MYTSLATCISLRYVAASLVAGLALSFTPTTPALADEDPGVRAPRVRMHAPRVRKPARVRTVVRTRVVVVPQPVYYTCGGCAPVVVVAPRYYAPRYYAPRYYAGCGGCARPFAAPYYWAVRYARYRYGRCYYC